MLRGLIAQGAELERLATGFEFVEGPVWNPAESSVLFTDVPRDAILRWHDGEVTTWRHPSNKANGLTYDPEGRLIACEHSSSRVSRTEPRGEVSTVAAHWQGRELNSPNDVVVRSDGAVYFTDPSDGRTSDHWGRKRPRELDFHGVFLVKAREEKTELLVDDFEFPNGLCLSPDETVLYVNDTRRMHIRAFDLRPDGTLASDRVFAVQEGSGRLEDGVPDGMKADEHGNLWATGPGGIWILSPEGRELGRLDVPEFAANLNWGGPDWSELYITATTSLYRIKTAVRGANAPYR